jgi:hypothetical protein
MAMCKTRATERADHRRFKMARLTQRAVARLSDGLLEGEVSLEYMAVIF